VFEILPGGYRHLALEDVDSTNQVALVHARAGADGNLWVSAKRQLQGRGSRGRNWVSEAGNLYSSLLIELNDRARDIQTLAFVASLAIHDAILDAANESCPEIKLKWPNDVLLNGRKTSGILLESHFIDERRLVILGIGINIAHFPLQTTHGATCLASEGITTTPRELLRLLAGAMDKRLGQWDMGWGFSDTRRDWTGVAAGLGKLLEIQVPESSGLTAKTGTFRGIDERGLLELETGSGKIERISVADIFFA
jgi:BirA family biotin operon repressor/biotin-[acetyl-CoA-carboxylase] ligase